MNQENSEGHMFKVRIDERELKFLALIDPSTGAYLERAMLESEGALSDGQFVYNAEHDLYDCDEGTYEWWRDRLAEWQDFYDVKHRLVQAHGTAAVDAVLSQCDDWDLEQASDWRVGLLVDAFPEFFRHEADQF